MKIFRYIRYVPLTVAAILVLFVIQAFCDLALPYYTSAIVDIGIQQGGIPDAAIKKIRPSSLLALERLMSPEDAATVRAAYTPDGDGNYVLSATDKKQLATLDTILTRAMAAAIDGENKTETQEGHLAQKAALYVKSEYTALGVDMGALQTSYMAATGAKMLGVAFASALAAVIVSLLASRAAAKIGFQLRGRIFAKVLSFSSTELDRFSTASLITRSTNDVQQIQTLTVVFLRMVLYAPVLGIGGIVMVAHTRTGMSWIIVAAVAAIVALVGALVGIAMPKFRLMQTLIDRLNLVSREMLTGIFVVRAFGRERHEEARFETANRELMSTQLFTNRTMSFMFPVMMLIMNIVVIGIVWFGAQRVDLGGFQVGSLIAFITYTMLIVTAFMMMSMISIFLPRGNVAAARIEEILNTEPVIADPAQPACEDREQWDGAVAFNNVSFRFPGAEKNVIEHISFTAQPGKTTAIVGSTGSGKSTIVRLIPRFYDVNGGGITIDGVDIRKLSQRKLHDIMGFVPQKGVLFSGTIESNLKFGNPGIADEAMLEAATIAQASDFIEEREGKYQGAVSQGGGNVSGGQRQRISIARAIAKNPRIFIFDDSFSALDYKTDVALRRALAAKLKHATVIIVAQRLSTIAHADQIIVLDEGRIAGIGTHAQLLRDCNTYREIAGSQLSESEMGGGA